MPSKKKPQFPKLLTSLIIQEDPSVILFQNGKIIIQDRAAFAPLLSKHFRHCTFESFHRQMNNFGFKVLRKDRGKAKIIYVHQWLSPFSSIEDIQQLAKIKKKKHNFSFSDLTNNTNENIEDNSIDECSPHHTKQKVFDQLVNESYTPEHNPEVSLTHQEQNESQNPWLPILYSNQKSPPDVTISSAPNYSISRIPTNDYRELLTYNETPTNGSILHQPQGFILHQHPEVYNPQIFNSISQNNHKHYFNINQLPNYNQNGMYIAPSQQVEVSPNTNLWLHSFLPGSDSIKFMCPAHTLHQSKPNYGYVNSTFLPSNYPYRANSVYCINQYQYPNV